MKLKNFFFVLFFIFTSRSNAQEYSHWKAGEILVGKNNARYRLENYLGEGGFKTAWRASRIDASNKPIETVVVLEIDSRLSSDPEFLNAIVDSNRAAASIANASNYGHLFNIREASTLTSESSLNKHINVIFADEAKHDATKLFKEIHLQPSDAIEVKLNKLRRIGAFTDKVSNMLSILREHGYAHGDLNFSNILITEGAPQLSDFDTVTKVGSKLKAATIPYIAPESWNIRNPYKASSVSDEFANGVMLYKLIFSEYPIEDYKKFLVNEKPYIHSPELRGALSKTTLDKTFMIYTFEYNTNFPDEEASFSQFVRKRVRNKMNDLLQKSMSLPTQSQRDEAKTLIQVVFQHLEARLETSPSKRLIVGSIGSSVSKAELEKKVRELCLTH